MSTVKKEEFKASLIESFPDQSAFDNWIYKVEAIAVKCNLSLSEDVLCNADTQIIAGDYAGQTVKEIVENELSTTWHDWVTLAKAAVIVKHFSVSDANTPHQVINLFEEVSEHLGREPIDSKELHQTAIHNLRLQSNAANARAFRSNEEHQKIESDLSTQLRRSETEKEVALDDLSHSNKREAYLNALVSKLQKEIEELSCQQKQAVSNLSEVHTDHAIVKNQIILAAQDSGIACSDFDSALEKLANTHKSRTYIPGQDVDDQYFEVLAEKENEILILKKTAESLRSAIKKFSVEATRKNVEINGLKSSLEKAHEQIKVLQGVTKKILEKTRSNDDHAKPKSESKRIRLVSTPKIIALGLVVWGSVFAYFVYTNGYMASLF